MCEPTGMAGSLSQVAELALAPLVGLRLLTIWRAGSLISFGFGPPTGIPWETRESYALHTEGTWRIAGPEGVAVGSDDLNEPGEALKATPGFTYTGWDYDQGGDLLRERADRLLMGAAPDGTVVQSPKVLCVTSVSVDQLGGFVVRMTEDYRLEVLPAGSLGASWALLCKNERGVDYLVTEGSPSYHGAKWPPDRRSRPPDEQEQVL